MNDFTASVEMAERRLSEATAAVRDEFCAVEERVRRRAISPYAIGGIFLGALGLGYLAARRLGNSRRHALLAAPDGFLLGLQAVREVLPLLLRIGRSQNNQITAGSSAGCAAHSAPH